MQGHVTKWTVAHKHPCHNIFIIFKVPQVSFWFGAPTIVTIVLMSIAISVSWNSFSMWVWYKHHPFCPSVNYCIYVLLGICQLLRLGQAGRWVIFSHHHLCCHARTHTRTRCLPLLPKYLDSLLLGFTVRHSHPFCFPLPVLCQEETGGWAEKAEQGCTGGRESMGADHRRGGGGADGSENCTST